jgi:sugar lactone lactonase YvrE
LNTPSKPWKSVLFMTVLICVLAGPDHASGGQVTTLAEVDGGTGGVVVDAAGTIYSADFGSMLGGSAEGGNRLFSITPAGKTAVFAEGFKGASGVAIDSKGNFFQSNIRGGFVSKVTTDGQVSTFASDGLEGPVGIIIDAEDTLWVANCGSGSIQKVTSEGTSSRFVEDPLLKCPNGITLDDDHNLYAANFYDGNVIKITPAGEVSVLATLPGNNNGHVVHVDGKLFAIARSAHQIYEVSLSGEVKLFAGSGEKGGKDGPQLEASFCFPNDIAISPDGKTLYVNEVADETTDGMKLAPTRVRALPR